MVSKIKHHKIDLVLNNIIGLDKINYDNYLKQKIAFYFEKKRLPSSIKDICNWIAKGYMLLKFNYIHEQKTQ